MNNIVSGTVGLIHLIVSIIALITGLYILLKTKGTKRHKQIGYIYVFSMILLNVTAFMIYRVYGKFGIFHYFAIISSLTLFAGLYPVLSKKSKDYLLQHFNYMYWSVIGLYCAFMAELFTRLPIIKYIGTKNKITPLDITLIYTLLFFSIAIVIFIGNKYYKKYGPIWRKQYEQKE